MCFDLEQQGKRSGSDLAKAASHTTVLTCSPLGVTQAADRTVPEAGCAYILFSRFTIPSDSKEIETRKAGTLIYALYSCLEESSLGFCVGKAKHRQFAFVKVSVNK